MPRRKDRKNHPTDGNDEIALEPLIDRVLELDLFRQHIRRVADDASGYAVLLLGESGVGKSRLAAEVAKEARELGMKSISIQCLGRGAEPLLPFREGLAAYLGRSPERIRRTLTGAAPHLLDSVPFIGAFLGKLGETLAEGTPDTSLNMKGVYEELARMLTKIAANDGLFLLVEDLHEADSDTLYFLNYLLQKVRHYKIIIVVTIQEEQLDDVPHLAQLVAQWTATGYAALTVVPLERAHVGEYVRRFAAEGRPADEATVDRLFRLTGGNPFFLRETLNLIDQEIEPHAASKVIPPRTDAVLRRRLARADETTLRFLRAAAVVLETTQKLEPIQFVMESEPREAIEALNSACNLRLMREGSGGEIEFVHSLMQRAVYGDMGASQRRYLHTRAGEWFEHHGSLASATFHFEQAERTEHMVRTGMRAAARAESAGMYHTALMLYQKLRPYVTIEELGPLLGRALIVLGDWDDAEELVNRLPIDDSRVRLMRSELRFVRGDFKGAKAEAEMALMGRSADRIQVLIRLADIELYLGDFSSAQRYSHSALQLANKSGSANLRARCLGMIAATEFFGGDLVTSHSRFSEALDLLEGLPEDDRDRGIYTAILGNFGVLAEARNDWTGAERYHHQALRLRREVADARGVLHSLHAIGRARIGQNDRSDGMRYIDEAEQLAIDLDETLERAKIWNTRAELSLDDGDSAGALELAERALGSFSQSRTQYDITHARITMSLAASACGRDRQAVEQGAIARASVEAMGYGLLRHLYPQVAWNLTERIAGALTAFACGDALGRPWEGAPPSQIRAADIERMPARPDSPRGTTSDDTALTLLVARHLTERDADADAHAFLAELVEEATTEIPGIGPSTMAAIEHFRAHRDIPSHGGATNGAAMRALPIGWALPHREAERRRQVAIEISRATHADPAAQVAACVIATCASWALEGAGPALVLEAAKEEARDAASIVGTSSSLADMLDQLAVGAWHAPPDGISLDPYETVTAVLSRVAEASNLGDTMVSAVRLGGDTDTVSALVGGLLGSRFTPEEVRAQLAWHRSALLSELEEPISDMSAALATTRAVFSPVVGDQ